MSHFQSTCQGCGRIHRWNADTVWSSRHLTEMLGNGFSCTHCGGDVETVEVFHTADREPQAKLKKKGMFCLFGALLGRKD